MRKQTLFLLFGIFLALVLGGQIKTSAQDTTGGCFPEDYDAIIDQAFRLCGDMDPNTICYANPRITSLFSDGRLFRSGNEEDLVDFRELFTEPQQINPDQHVDKWGIAALRVESPAELAQQAGYAVKDVTLVVYGNPQLAADGQTETGAARFIMRMQEDVTAACPDIFKEGVIVEVPVNDHQSPDLYVGEVVINGITLRLSSRALLTATEDNTRLRVTGLEGTVTVTDSLNRTETLEPGQYLEIQFQGNDLNRPEITVLPTQLTEAERVGLAAHPQELGALFAAQTDDEHARRLSPGVWVDTAPGNRKAEERVIVPGDVDVWVVDGRAGQELTVYLACPDSDPGGNYRCFSIGLQLPEINIYGTDGIHLGRSGDQVFNQTQLSVTADRDGEVFIVAGGDETSTGRYVICAEFPADPDRRCGPVPAVLNRPPEINAPDQVTLEIGQTQDVPISVTDPDDSGILNIASQSINPDIVTAVYHNPLTLTGMAQGTTNVTITATDLDGGTASKNVSVIVNCVPCKTWGYYYTVGLGDTLYNISQRAGVTVGEMQAANCLPNPDVVVVNQVLCVPRGDIPHLPDLVPAINPAATSVVCYTDGHILTSYPSATCMFTVVFTVSNSGSAPTTPTDVRVLAGNAGITFVSIPALAPTQSQTFSTQVSGTTDCFVGGSSCPVRVEVDVYNYVQETIEINNTAVTELAVPFTVLPDLYVVGIELPQVNWENNTTAVSFTIVNGSDVPILTPFNILVEGSNLQPQTVTVVDGMPALSQRYITVFFYSPWRLSLPESTLLSLPSANVYFSGDARMAGGDALDKKNRQTEGTPCSVWVTLDSANQVLEANEYNNSAERTNACPYPGPD